jgi:iron(III) transport system ATP-binding protein
MLTVENLFKQYVSADGTPGGGVFGVNFDIEEGELFTLLGPSGCGKTTTLRSIAGLERPSGGHIVLDGKEIFNAERRLNVPMYDRDIGMVFQSYAIWPHMNVFENAAYPLKVGRKNRYGTAEIRERVRATLALVGLEEFIERPSTQLSGGQQQRLALARALTREPTLLLLDEPLSNLDAQLREQMRGELKRLQRETGVTAIYVTHDQAEALAISDRVAVMRDGLIMQLGTPKEIYERPTSDFVARFIGRTNLLHGSLDHDVAAGAEQRITTEVGPLLCTFPAAVKAVPEASVVVRPENIRVRRVGSDGASSASDRNQLTGTIRDETYLGEIAEYLIDVNGIEIIVRSHPETALTAGDSVEMTFSVADTLALIEDVTTGAADEIYQTAAEGGAL